MLRSRNRQSPTSCQSCRSKKLKCDRARPCANCAGRDIHCVFLIPPEQRGPSSYNNADLLRRIEVLESLVLPQSNPEDGGMLETPSSEDALVPDVALAPDGHLRALEDIGTHEDTLLSSPSSRIAITTNDTDKINTTTSHSPAYPDLKTLVLPTYQVACLLFDNFTSNVDHVCRILHIPTARSCMRTCYLQLGRDEPVAPSKVALLLSLFSLSVFFYPISDSSEVAESESRAVQLSKFWFQGAWEALDSSQQTSPRCLEEIQACIIMSYVATHVDGLSIKARLLSGMAMFIARELRLQLLDDEQVPTKGPTLGLQILTDLEVKRRVWWHIVTSDWLRSTISGPQEGTYLINPRHMHVREPGNYNDDEIGFEGKSTLEDETQPTSMTFFLARIRLAHLCRDMTDTLPLGMPGMTKVHYDHIIALDTRLQNYMSTLPFFLRPDKGSRQKASVLETVYPHIGMMRYCILAAAQSRRFRLHQRFLLRQSSDSRYSYSRDACLESARQVIRMFKDGDEPNVPSLSKARMAIAVHYTHLALSVLVLDLCFNKGHPGEEDNKAEVAEALRILACSGHRSALTTLSLSSLRQVLQKYEVELPQPACANWEHIVADVELGAVGVMKDRIIQTGQLDAQRTVSSFDTFYNELWNTADQDGIDVDLTAWDNIMSALDTQPF